MNPVVLIITAYLLGSVPFGFLFARAHGIDLRTIGSANIGATNLSRALGKKWGCLCFFLDVLKGLLPTLAATLLYVSSRPAAGQLVLVLAVGIAAVAGHIFPVYLKFKGGKGVATSFGLALGLWPYFTLCACIAFLIWLCVVLLTGYISLASITAAVAFPVVLLLAIILIPVWLFAGLWPLLIAAVAIPAVVIIRHRENINRLLKGTENKISRKRPEPSAE